jgi:hypothetical protein
MQTFQIRAYTARRAQNLAAEGFPGCTVRTLNVFVEGSVAWCRVATKKTQMIEQ